MAPPKGFKPVALAAQPTEIEVALQKSLPPELRQIKPEDITVPKPEPKKPLPFAPAPTPKEEEEFEAEIREKEGRWSWNPSGLINRWAGMAEGLAEGLGIKDALTIMSMEGMPGDPLSPNRIGALRKAGKNKLADKLQKKTDEIRQRAIKSVDRWEHIERGYDEMEEDIARRTKENHFLWNAITDAGEAVAAIPALAYEVLGPKRVSSDRTERQQGKEFGQMFAGGFIGGTGKVLRNPIDSFEARPVLTLVTWLPALRAISKGASAAGKAKVRKAQTAAEAAADAIAETAAERWVETLGDVATPYTAKAKRWLLDGLEQGNPRTTALVEDLIRKPEQAKSRAESLFKRLSEEAKKMPEFERKPAPETPKVRGPMQTVIKYEIGEQGLLSYDKGKQTFQAGMRRTVKALQEGLEGSVRKLDDIDAELADLTPNKKQWEIDAKQREGVAQMEAKKGLAKIEQLTENRKRETQKRKTFLQQLEAHKKGAFLDRPIESTRQRPVFPESRTFKRITKQLWETMGDRLPKKWGVGEAEFAAALTGILGKESLLLFKDPKLRTAVVKELVKDTKKVSPKVNTKTLKKELDRVLIEAADNAGVAIEEFPNIVVNGEVIFSPQVMPEILQRVGAARDIFFRKIDLNDVSSRVLQSLGKDIVADLRLEGIKTGIKRQKEAFGKEVITAPALAEALVESVILKAADDPIAVSFNPKDIVSAIRNNKAKWIERLSLNFEQMGFPKSAEAIGRQIDRIANRLEAYEKIPAEYGGGWAPKGFADVLHWQNVANKVLQDPSGWRAWMRVMKSQLTARNLPSHFNNLLSNVGVQFMRRGSIIDPVRFLAEALKLWLDFRKNKIKNPKELTMMEAIEKTGVLDTDLIDAEVGVASGIPGTKPVNKLLEYGYKYWGDGALKLEETVTNYKTLHKHYETLRNGDTIVLETSPRQKVVLVKQNGKMYVRGSNKPLNETQLAELSAQAAKEPALNVFFDYGDVPIALQFLKAAPILGVASPFFTWAWKALDIPFLKKGLATRALEGGFMVETTNPTINAQQLAQAARLGLRRTGLINAMRQQINQHEDLSDLFKWMPSQSRQVLSVAFSNPAYMAGKNFAGLSWAGPTEMLFRGLANQWLNLTVDEEKLEKWFPREADWEKAQLTPDEKKLRKLWAKKMTGQLWTPSNALELIGVAGSPIMDIIQYVEDTDEPRKAFRWEDIYKKFGALLLGGSTHRVLDVGLAYADELNDFSTRSWAIKPDEKETEEFLVWAIRRVSGLGYSNPKNIYTRGKKMFSDMKTAWKASIVKPIKDKVSDLESQLRSGRLSPEEMKRTEEMVDGLLKKQSRYEEIIEFEVGKMQDDYYQMVEKIEGKK